ncbi:MAG: VWA domain-containing protein, partial [Planctomycetes bacterium]|nr:VWA domain-containing protein [Planctomycetota bacterium]
LRVIAAGAIGELRSPEAVAGLCDALEARDWSLQKAAAEALGKIRAKESIEPLLQRFEKEEGLMIEVIHGALVAITGQDFRFAAENWRKWWDKFGVGFVLPTDAEIAIAKAKAEKALEGYAKPDKRKYHEIETLSRKMLFVIDVSGSMRDKIILPPGATPEQEAEFPDRVKMEIAKKATIDFLATVDRHVYFNIITFAGNVEMWRDNLVSGSARTAAIKHVAKLKALEPSSGGRKGGGSGEEQKTNTYGALLAAFGQADAAVPDWKARTKVDTIFLVTDGLPTTGEIVEVPKLIREITELNRARGVVLHVITFDKIAHQQLTPLAAQNGGQCVLRGH